MRLKQSLLLGLTLLVAPLGCERNRTVKTIPAPPPAEARAEPVLEEDLNNNLPTERPSEETKEDDTGVDGDRPAPAVEAGPEQPPTMPPR